MPAEPSDPTPITFVIPGQRIDSPGTRGAADSAPTATPMGLRGRVKAAVQVGQRRSSGDLQRVQAVPGEDVVVLRLAGGPTLVLHPATARDLMLAQGGLTRRAARGADPLQPPEAAPDEVAVPAQLRWQGLEQSAGAARGATRGFLGDVLLAAVEVITGPLEDRAQDLAAGHIVQRVDDQVDEGVYALGAEALERLKGRPRLTSLGAGTGGPVLVFVHGTFSDTQGTFGKLWLQHPQRVRTLFDTYRQQVYALDHATLGKSPIDNAWTLAQACPAGTRLHLVTHSRGGLVAEVLARAAELAKLDDAARTLFRVENLPKKLVDTFDARERQAAQRALDAQQRTLDKLIRHLHEQHIQVERIVRVACPARGTLLASQRFDAYLSVFKWTLDLAQIPVLPALVDFIGGVAQRRTDPARIPGVAAMVPDSPLVRWLHAAEAPARGELRVVAGDLEGDTLGSWLKTLMADAFYWTDNDLVVQTRSMYGGVPRQAGASFVLDQGGQVSHFNYFSNERTVEAVVNGLIQDQPLGWRPIGPLSYAGSSSTGVRGAARDSIAHAGGTSPSARPAVFVLPGILGSHLKVDGRRIWLSFRLFNGLDQLRYTGGDAPRVEPDGALGRSYDELMGFLARTHEVIEFAYDWRCPIEQEARRLGRAVDAALNARARSGEPVRLLAHSMGGLLARTLQLECKPVWDRMMAHPGARLLMLGTPNGGSWAPMQVLSGDDTLGNTLTAFGAPFQDHQARNWLAALPGFLQLQAGLLDEARGLHRSETWEALADDDLRRVREYNWWHGDERQVTPYRWGVPPQPVLDAAIALRRRLDAQRDQALGAYRGKLVQVIGQAAFTPDGYELADDGLAYLNAPGSGDGRVTLESALLPGVPTWQLACEHGHLCDAREAFEAYQDLLVDGTTTRLRAHETPSAARGVGGVGRPPTAAHAASAAAAAHVRSRPGRERLPTQPPRDVDDTNLLLLPADAPAAAAGASALRISVLNGDLSFVRHPLVLGHYASNAITGTERVVNRLIGGTMRESLDLGQYPDHPGTHQFFANTGLNRDNPLQVARPESVLVVGLGEEGKLDAPELAYTVKLGVLALAQRLVEQPGGAPLQFELASTLIGSGGAGISAGQSAQLLAQGVREADEALRDLNERLGIDDAGSAARAPGRATPGTDSAPPPRRRWPRVGQLFLVELYLDRASEAWRALQVQAQASPGHFRLSETVLPGQGALRRPLDGGYRGADYDYIRAISGGVPADPTIEFTLDTKRARAEVRSQSTQARLVRELVALASNDQNRDTQIGRTLFQLLVPVEMEPFLGGSTEMLLELDRGTAGIPWEMLDTRSGLGGGNGNGGGGGDGRPWAIRAKLVRKLRLADYRQTVSDARPAAHVLVIGEPQCDGARYPRLAGARAEARAVCEQLMPPQALGAERVRALIASDDTRLPGPGAREVINALMEREWRIVHIAGHGEPPQPAGTGADTTSADGSPGDPRGVVLSGGTFLGPREIRNMRVVPELVFVNCCHLAGRQLGQLLASEQPGYDRAHFASGVAEELIKIGVRCVIAAGWAVEDEPAKSFATTFYAALLRGARFIDAVALAREAAHTLGGNTWAAYQCYGDPDWVLRRDGADAQRPAPSLLEEYANVTSHWALVLALETLAVRSQFQGAPRETQRARIRHLEARYAATWGALGHVAEAFGAAWEATGARTAAVAWYEKAVAAADGSASFKASEQLGDLRVQLAWSRVEAACSSLRALDAHSPAAPLSAPPPPAPSPPPPPLPSPPTRGRKAARTAKAGQAALSAVEPSNPTLTLAVPPAADPARQQCRSAIAEARELLTRALTLLGQLVALQPTMVRQSLLASAYKRLCMIERAEGRPVEAKEALERMVNQYERAEGTGQRLGAADRYLPTLNLLAAQCAQALDRGDAVSLDAARLASVRQVLIDRTRDDPDFASVTSLTELRLVEALAQGRLADACEALLSEYDDLAARMRRSSHWRSVLDQLHFVLHGVLHGSSATEAACARRLIAHVERFVDDAA